MADFSPMMTQYLKIKEQYKDALLFFRLGDFYEMFFDDAVTASRELELVLTGRDCGQDERAPMCGVPFHSAESYIARLVAKGYKVAICEQVEDPATAKGIVRREVVRVITPGTVTESSMLDEGKNNYIGCIFVENNAAGVAFADISTGDLQAAELQGKFVDNLVINEIARFTPAELIANRESSKRKTIFDFLKNKITLAVDTFDDERFDFEASSKIIKEHFTKLDDEIFEKKMLISAVGALMAYLYETQKNNVSNIEEIKVYNDSKYMTLDENARRTLELTQSERRREVKGSLLWVLDSTKTAMGKRMLRQWVENPLVTLPEISMRLNAVDELYSDTIRLMSIKDLLSGISDIERIITRIVYETANARELKVLSNTIKALPELKAALKGFSSKMLNEIERDIDLLSDVYELIETAIIDDPPFTVREGGLIKDGFNAELDELRSIVSGGKSFLVKLEEEEQQKTGIKKLKIGYNRVFGYYIEVLNSYKELVPEHYIRKQTLSNCERYITPELKELESKVLGSQERIAKLEYEIFAAIRAKTADQQYRIRRTASAIAKLDSLCSLAYAASQNGYTRPIVDLSDRLEIKNGRHPVVEKFTDEPFVPNDALLDCEDNRTVIITGPNMAGKSTYMRQIALITIMAQIGSFVPAESAVIGIVDGIFTRIGASDDLSMGQSTFMSEMSEVAFIIKNATRKSLIILDEVGRGTSTYDGMSIARALLEYITDKKNIGARTLFATHYHELAQLEDEISGVKNYYITAKKRGDDIIFLRRIVRGASDGSYGIEVARLAGVPKKVADRAKEILDDIESNKGHYHYVPKSVQSDSNQLSLGNTFADNANLAIIDEIKNLDINVLTPIEAMTILHGIIKRLN